jgi:dehydrogenase/reductase SDR family member 7B
MKDLQNKVVWITGASSGIGEALVKLLSKRGAKIVISSRRCDELIRVKNEALLGESESMLIVFDLSDISQLDVMVKKVIVKFGRIDILINNAGISQRSKASETAVEIDRKIMEVNYFGTVALTKAVLPYMIAQKSGYIVSLSSLMGKIGFYNRTAYAASKHALHGFFDSLRMEVLEDNIKVMLVCPGYVKTNISLNALNSNGEAHGVMDKNQEKGMSAEECATAIVHGIENNKREMILGGKEVVAVWIKRFFPRVFHIIAKNQKH